MSDDTVFIAAQFEPAFTSEDHPVAPADSVRRFAVRIGFQVRNSDNAGARGRYDTLLTDLPAATFRPYRLGKDGNGSDQLTIEPAIELAAVGTPSGNDRAALIAWMDERLAELVSDAEAKSLADVAAGLAARTAHSDRWVSASQAVADTEVLAEEIDASQLFGSVAAWDAPLPQDLGITRTVRAQRKTVEPFEGLVLVPFFGDVAVPQTIAVSATTPQWVTFAYDAGGQVGPVFGQCQLTQLPSNDPSSRIDETTGFLRASVENDEDIALLNRLAERGASLFSSFAPLVAIDWRDAGASPEEPSPSSTFPRLVWRALNGLGTLLDPLTLALAPDRQEGPFVSLLVDATFRRFPTLTGSDIARVVEVIRGTIRDGLAKLSPPDDDKPEERRALAGLLENVFQLNEDSGPRLLTSMLDLYVANGYPGDRPDLLEGLLKKLNEDPTGDPGVLDRLLESELGQLATQVDTDEGVEALLGRLFTATGIKDALRSGAGLGTAADGEAIVDAFMQTLGDNFDSAHAIRHTLGALFERAVVNKAGKPAAGTPWLSALRGAIADGKWFATRLGLEDAETFAVLAAKLPHYASGALEPDAAARDHLKSALTAAYKSVTNELDADPTDRRFVPDHAPRPLSVQIGVDDDTTNLDDFGDRYNGVAMMIRRSDGDGSWAHANLATLTVGTEHRPDPTIHPMLPVAVDGRRRLTIDYSGIPLSSSALAEFTPDAIAPTSKAFYTADAPKDDFTLPALVYGVDYEVAAFALSHSGSLPLRLQDDGANAPWHPVLSPPADAVPALATRSIPYRRTTAIGRVQITDSRGSRRIGVGIEGVQPLFGDYPRLGRGTEGDDPATIDLARNIDGSAAFTIPANGETAVLRIESLGWWSKSTTTGKFNIKLFGEPNPVPGSEEVDDAFVVEIGGTLADGYLELHFAGGAGTCTVTCTGSPGLTVTGSVPPLAGTAVWVRLTVMGLGQQAALSFADTFSALRTLHASALPKRDPLLLMAPTTAAENQGQGIWKDDYEQAPKLEITFPKVTFTDFDRWHAKGSAPKGWETLFAAYLGRMVDPRLAEAIDSLPDPAVGALLVELTPLDGLAYEPRELAAKCLPRREWLSLRTFAERPGPTDLESILVALGDLSRSHSALVTVTATDGDLTIVPEQSSAGSSDPEWALTVNVPPGLVARLSVRPLVAKTTVDAAFDAHFAELASGTVERDGVTYYEFDGASVAIEAMSDLPDNREGLLRLAAAAIEVAPAGSTRRYDLVARHPVGGDSWLWRKLGSLGTMTQRWRHTGRPIYAWVNPRDHSDDDGAVSPVLRMKAQVKAIEDFEREAFSRDSQDADLTTKILGPDPAGTALHNLHWEAESATWFRHRFTLRSRYAGALRRPLDAEVPVFGLSGENSWLSVAMLADRARVQLTRPRLRALIPLTRDPDEALEAQSAARGEEAEPRHAALTPPVLALLDEPPSNHGGLADRLAAEVRTGFAYELAKSASADTGSPQTASGEEHLRIESAGKEAGRDGQETYTPADAEVMQALALSTEGPIGLTFDSAVVDAPSFVNSAHLLGPRLLRSDSSSPGALEEHFLSVGLTHYLDPHWCTGSLPTDLLVGAPWWIELDEAQQVTVKGTTVLDITRGDFWKVAAERAVIDPLSPSKLIDIVAAEAKQVRGLALLYLPLEGGLVSLSVFGLPIAGNAVAGDSNLPLLLSSFEWRLPAGAATLELTGKHQGWATSASPTTHMNWTRTAKNFAALHSGNVENADLSRHLASEVRVQPVPNAKDSYEFARTDRQALSLETELSRQPDPLEVHRHLALIHTIPAPGAGRPIEIYSGRQRLLGGTFTRSDNSGWVRVVEFETRALPLSCQAGTREVARFDVKELIGSRFDNGEIPPGVTLYLRPLGGTAGNASLKSVTIRFGADGAPTHRLALASRPGHLLGLLIELKLDNDVHKLRGWSLRAGGDRSDLDIDRKTTEVGPLGVLSTVEIAVTNVQRTDGQQGEFWFDVSMLTLPLPRHGAPDADGFSFDWLFTGRAASPAGAVSAAGLQTMTEGEARIVSISPPIQLS